MVYLMARSHAEYMYSYTLFSDILITPCISIFENNTCLVYSDGKLCLLRQDEDMSS